MSVLADAWYRNAAWLKLLRPWSALFKLLVTRRCRRQRQYQIDPSPLPVPVIVVGNITVGGTGKTPLVIALIEHLRQAGYTPGVVSRGYGTQAPYYPFSVQADTVPEHGGDEPCLIVRRTGAPLFIDPNRMAAANALLEQHDCDVLISDDGLQHYAMPRDIEIAVIDAARGLGNARCLPEGPLREPPERLEEVDWVVFNGQVPTQLLSLPPLANVPVAMQLQPGELWSLQGKGAVAPANWSGGRKVHAVAGIGHPQRFFDTLNTLGFDVIEHPFADHAHYEPEQLTFEPELPVIMTEKDAVKCMEQPPAQAWALPVEACLEPDFLSALLKQLAARSAQLMDKHNGSQAT